MITVKENGYFEIGGGLRVLFIARLAVILTFFISSCKSDSMARKEDRLLLMRGVAQECGFKMLSLVDPDDSVLVYGKDLEKLAKDITKSHKYLKLVITPFQIESNGKVDLSTTRSYLIYDEGDGLLESVKVWPR